MTVAAIPLRDSDVQGIELARIGVERARDPHLQALARLMMASQAGENRLFNAWWQRWFDLPMPECTAKEGRYARISVAGSNVAG
jgi:uncharacterized protein (DUF305 family)